MVSDTEPSRGRLLVMLLFLVMALQNLGVELLPLIAGLGIARAGIALALQGEHRREALGRRAGFGPATGEIDQAALEALRRNRIAIPFLRQEIRLLERTTAASPARASPDDHPVRIRVGSAPRRVTLH